MPEKHKAKYCLIQTHHLPTSLTHEVVDDSVEMRSLVSESFLPCAQSFEVLACFWHDVLSEGHLNTASRCSTNGDIKEANWVSHSDVENFLS